MKLLKTQIFGKYFWYREDDRFIGQRIALGKYEEYETILMESQLKGARVVVDVGANIGYYTLLMAKVAKKVYALEPDRECYEILKKNVEENNLKNVVLLNVAASDKTEKRNMFVDKNNLGNGRLDSKDCFADARNDEVLARNNVVVDCLRLDDILINEQKIDLIKIDTQGWEPAVIDGAKKIIERDIPTMFLEYSPAEYKDEKMKEYLQNVYKNIWSIDYWFYICRKGIHLSKETGYVDLWIKNKIKMKDYLYCFKYIQIKKIIKFVTRMEHS